MAADTGPRGGMLEEWGGKLSAFLGYAHLSHDLTTGLLIALLPFIRNDLHLNYFEAMALTSAYQITAGVAQLLGGWVGDRIGGKRAIAIGLAGVGICTVAVGLNSHYWVILAILVVQGIVSGCYHPSAAAALSGAFEPARRGRVFALHMVGGSIGFLIGPSVGAAIAEGLSWHWTFIILGIPAIIASVLIMVRLRLPQGVRAAAPAAGTAQGELGGARGVGSAFRAVAIVVVPVVVLQLIVGPLMSSFALFLVDKHQLTTGAAAMWITVVRAGGLVGSFLGGWLTDKWGRLQTIFLTLILTGPAVYLLTALPFYRLSGAEVGLLANLPINAALVAALLLYGVLGNVREGAMQTYLMDASPPRVRGTVFGIYFGVGQEGSSLVQPWAGSLMDVPSIGMEGVFSGIAIGSGALSLAGLALVPVAFRKRQPVPQV
jgi:FSR family fosmidomycin resistance protein-like MFS transporter